MGFSKSFPRTVEGSSYARWEEVEIDEQEEKKQEEAARNENIKLMKECIDDAKAIFAEKGYRDYQTDIVNTAIALFEKRASHSIYWKENKTKEKFNQLYGKK
ncbi:hypothetical protein JW707_04805 [Candidatus Woesearchaeota archaeon]|nr:hypothetical protein [Candidatus Woesearchaeota archaeon]